MRLISMTGFVLKETAGSVQHENDFNTAHLESIFAYATFLKQPLTLGMFVPCDKNNLPIDDSCAECLDNPNLICDYHKEAKERVLFEGFEILHNGLYITLINKDELSIDYWKSTKHFERGNAQLKTIEDLIPYNLELSPNVNKF